MDQGTQVVVETHSEYLVRRLQYLVAQGKCEPERASVAYLEGQDIDDETSPTIRHITIDQDGQLSESFGPGFFDQATNLMVDLFKYGSDN
jgi:predicted ATPase